MFSLNSDAAMRLATTMVAMGAVYLFHVAGYDLRRMPGYLRTHASWIALSVVLVIAAAVALLLSPVPPAGSDCVYTDQVWRSLHMVTTCDSDEFLTVAQHPGRLVEKNSYRQSRPLVVMVAGVLTPREPRLVMPVSEDSPVGQPGWLSYVVINTVLLACAMTVFRRLNAPVSSLAALAVGIFCTFLLFNDVVKGFFWSAHTQMWNVLMPLIAIAVSLALLERPVRSWRFIVATGLLLGLGLLAYASFLVCVAGAVISIALGSWMRDVRRVRLQADSQVRSSLLTEIGKVLVLLTAFAVPTLIWIGVIRLTAGGFFVSEAQDFREFIWILDAWREGGMPALLARASVFLAEFRARLWEGLWPVLMPLAVVLAAGLVSPSRLGAVVRDRSRILLACAITAILCLGFFAAVGFYRNRLAFNAVVPVLVATSVIATGLLERQPRGVAIATVLLLGLTAAGYVVLALSRITWPY